MNLYQKIINKRPEIIWAETAAILHDIGKLSEIFIKYRQTWRKIEDGYNKDPHDHDFLNNDSLINDFVDVRNLLQKPIKFFLPTGEGEKELSIADVVNNHIDPGKSLFLKMLKAADSKDAAIDRNNPFFSAGQTGKIYKTDVFGTETEFDVASVENSRKHLYKSIKELLPDGEKDFSFTDRDTLLKIIQKHFDKAFSDITRPDNDTTLWEHCYSVASIFKVILLHYVIYGESFDHFDKVRFGIFGTGWNGLSYLSHGHKIGDIVGRKNCIETLKQQIKEMVEYDFLIGNMIYEDDNGIFFLVPMLPSEIDIDNTAFDMLTGYGQLLKQIQEKVISISIKLSCGELLPKFHLIQDTKHMTHLVKCINGLKKKSAYPILRLSDELSKQLEKEWVKAGQVQVCPVCGKRPIKENWDICEGCISLRKNGNFASRLKKKTGENQAEDTPFISEIVSANKNNALKKRAALVVVKIGLENWLNGRMVRSLFVSEAKGFKRELDELGDTKSFEAVENERKAWLSNSPWGNLIEKGYEYRRIVEEIDRCYRVKDCKDDEEREYAKNIVFLYDRRNLLNRNPEEVRNIWSDYEEAAIKEYGEVALLPNILCAKTPTPSTILDIWNTTQKFFNDFKENKEEKLLGLTAQKRWKANIVKPEGVTTGATYEGQIHNTSIEVVWLSDNDNSVWIIGDIKINEGDQIYLKSKLFGLDGRDLIMEIKGPDQNVPYFPCRVITATPDMFMAIVPADRAIEISQILYDGYIKRFGKVIGRLPMSIGNIFFTDRMPMFVVLDAGKRMLNNFERLHLEPAEIVVGKKQDELTKSGSKFTISIAEVKLSETIRISSDIKWELPFKLGDGGTDYYHPYVFIKQGSKDYSVRKNYFKTIMGDVIHCTEIESGDTLKLFPNYYDFEFLDSNTRRHDLSIGSCYRRRSNVADFKSKPFLLDELSQKIMYLWQLFTENSRFKEITDSKLKNMQALWLTKYQEWNVNLESIHSDNYKRWIYLIESSLNKELGSITDYHDFLLETIKSGLFFDTLEFYMGILKKKNDDKGDN